MFYRFAKHFGNFHHPNLFSIVFAGNEFWKYDKNDDPPVEDGYPKPISQVPWNFALDSIDAAIQWDSQKTYFFKGQKYYIYDHCEVI